MCLIAKEKLDYHNVLVESVLERYHDSDQKDKLIDLRMSEQSVTLHMSSKRAMEKKKIRARRAENNLLVRKASVKHSIMDKKVAGVLDQYTDIMGQAISAEIAGDHSLLVNASPQQKSDKKKQKLIEQEELDHGMRVIQILDASQTYMEQNLNAACNNMSLLSLHAFEFGEQIEKKRQD